MDRNDGGPAFPQLSVGHYGGEPVTESDGGMTLRDWFAGQAMTGIISDGMNMQAKSRKFDDVAVWVAQSSYHMADAMLQARNG